MQKLEKQEEGATREQKHIQIDSAMGNLENAIGELEGFVNSLHPEPDPDNVKSETVSPVPSFIDVLHGLPGNLNGLTSRVRKANARLTEYLV